MGPAGVPGSQYNGAQLSNGDHSMPEFVTTHRLTHEASLKMLAAGVTKADELSRSR